MEYQKYLEYICIKKNKKKAKESRYLVDVKIQLDNFT